MTASAASIGRRRAQRGMSLPEILVTLVIFSGLMIIVYSMIEKTLHLTLFNESHNDLTIMTERGVNAIQIEILQTRTVFEEDATGAAYRAALQLPVVQSVWPATYLPVIDSTITTIDSDIGTGANRL